MTFDYNLAFSRNLGFLSPADQKVLRRSRVAVPGLGGTGGAQVLALARMGIGNFSICDPDTFELVNFNRQVNATMDTLGRSKAEVARDAIWSINPEAHVRILPGKLDRGNVAEFIADADVVVDSLDFYCFEERLDLYRQARQFGVWVLNSPPLGFGFTMMAFDPNGMSFEDYFGFKPGMSTEDMLVRFVAGLSPKDYMLRYLNKADISPSAGRLPSVGAAPYMVAGAIATEVTALLLGRTPKAAPIAYQFDARLRKFWIGAYRKNSPIHMLRRLLISRIARR